MISSLRGGERRGKVLAYLNTMLICLLFLLSACGNANSSISKQDGASASGASGGSQTLQLAPHSTTQTRQPGAPPSGSGSIPAAFPRYFSFGVMSSPGTASSLDE